MDFVNQLIRRERIGLTLVGLAVIILAVALLAPQDATLKGTSPVVYLHGALVWISILAFTAAGVVGLAALALRHDTLHAWSGALARTGLLFWVIYLPLSMWASKATWNGVPLSDPRFRTAFQVLVVAAGFQAAAALWGPRNRMGSALNAILAAVILWVLILTTQDVMHPQNPMRSSAPTIQLFFVLLVGGCGLAAWQVTRWMRST